MIRGGYHMLVLWPEMPVDGYKSLRMTTFILTGVDFKTKTIVVKGIVPQDFVGLFYCLRSIGRLDA